MLLATLVLLLVSESQAVIPGHEIKSLPGYDGPLPTAQYSGYLSVDQAHEKFLHYWFVESANDPSTDPVVLWMNGGPGCSSLLGYMYEQGPLHFDPNFENETIPKLVENPNAWNRIANMLFLEAPASVGFSYYTNPIYQSTNDNMTAEDNFHFLVNWFSGYPEFKNHDFYITGESYAGIYVPTLVARVMEGNDNGESNINLKGFMVGNGCTGNQVGDCSYHGLAILIEFLFGHGLYSEELHEKLVAACPDVPDISAECKELVAQMVNESGLINAYDIYEPCIDSRVDHVQPMWMTQSPLTDILSNLGITDCINAKAATAYLNLAEVREALHVMSTDEIGEWHVCSTTLNYTRSVASLLPIYPTLISKYRTLIYNGDVDACVPYIGDEEWTSGLNLTVDKSWHPWMLDGQVAGYATSYQLNGFQFATVKGSGHMVPQYKPEQAYAMFERYLNNQPL